jgi:hypothetical protein
MPTSIFQTITGTPTQQDTTSATAAVINQEQEQQQIQQQIGAVNLQQQQVQAQPPAPTLPETPAVNQIQQPTTQRYGQYGGQRYPFPHNINTSVVYRILVVFSFLSDMVLSHILD